MFSQGVHVFKKKKKLLCTCMSFYCVLLPVFLCSDVIVLSFDTGIFLICSMNLLVLSGN